MSDRIATLISNDGVINLILDDKSYLIDRSHPNYPMIKEALSHDDADSLTDLVDIPKAVVRYSEGSVSVIDGEIFHKGEPLHNTLTERILNLMAEEFPFEGMLKFLDNLMSNSSSRAVNELYDFLENKGLPITDDGCFLAYKGIRDNWKDAYSGKIDNSVGNVVTFDRNQVDDNRAHTCSYGLHVGALEYVRNYCQERVIIVKVNPKNVVSVPRDHNAQKVRVCEYEVLREYTGEMDRELPKPQYHSDGSDYQYEEDDPYDADEDPCRNCYEDCNYCDHYDL